MEGVCEGEEAARTDYTGLDGKYLMDSILECGEPWKAFEERSYRSSDPPVQDQIADRRGQLGYPFRPPGVTWLVLEGDGVVSK